MKTRGRWAIALLGAGFAIGAFYLLAAQYAGGDVYPEYSSLRSDPSGTRLLFDSLARMPGISTTRNYLPLDLIPDGRATVLLVGCDAETFAVNVDELRAMEKLAVKGNRVVASLGTPENPKTFQSDALNEVWHVRVGGDSDPKHAHRLWFTEVGDWRVLESAGGKAVAIEHDFGKGSVALFAESSDFTNESTVARDRLATVATALGGNSRILFDEVHLGIGESGSVVAMARRFRLSGMALGLGLCAALFLWRNTSRFPPSRETGESTRLAGRTSLAGLLTLLRRHIPQHQLAAACWNEWLTANRRSVPEDRLERAGAAARGEDTMGAMREIQGILKGDS